MKKTCLLAALCLMGVDISAHDIEVPNADGVTIYYNYISDGKELEVTFAGDFYESVISEYSGVVVIPEEATLEGRTLKVTSIANRTFQNCYSLTSVIIPNSVTSLGNTTFSGCHNLTSVNIPNSVTTIGEYTFADCRSLTSVIIPNGVTNIGEYAFAGCLTLTSITIPESVIEIGASVFRHCCSLTSITIPDSVISIEDETFSECYDLTSITIGNSVETIGNYAFAACNSLSSVNIPNSVTNIGDYAFMDCGLTSVTLGNGVTNIGNWAFACYHITNIYCYAEQVPDTGNGIFVFSSANATLHVPAGSLEAYSNAEQWKDFKEIVALPTQDDYRPFVEDGKVWKVGAINSGNPVQWVEYFYLDGDTIIDGKTCKQMMNQRYVNSSFAESNSISQDNSMSYVGAWYEEDRKVYFCDATNKQFKLMYDFSLDGNDTLQINSQLYVVGPKQTGGIEGFKGTYREVRLWEDGESIYSVPWLEGVGGTDCPTTNVYPGYVDPLWFLMSCSVGEEVIYLLEGIEDGATPAEARKNRFDFTHTIKSQPKSPRRAAEQPLYGEYNEQLLGINLGPLDDAYVVRITDETGKTIYEKNINAANIVALNIDISSYAEGRYNVTVENSQETFTGEFDTQATGISDALLLNDHGEMINDNIFNLQGQRISSLQKGLNIVNGKKVLVK